jgi:hypothetical protein
MEQANHTPRPMMCKRNAPVFDSATGPRRSDCAVLIEENGALPRWATL